MRVYSRSPKVGNPIASILKSHIWGIPALIVLNPVSNFLGFTIRFKNVGNLSSATWEVSENRGPQYGTLNSRILTVRAPK